MLRDWLILAGVAFGFGLALLAMLFSFAEILDFIQDRKDAFRDWRYGDWSPAGMAVHVLRKRREKDFTRWQLARLLGVPMLLVYDVENGRRRRVGRDLGHADRLVAT